MSWGRSAACRTAFGAGRNGPENDTPLSAESGRERITSVRNQSSLTGGEEEKIMTTFLTCSSSAPRRAQ